MARMFSDEILSMANETSRSAADRQRQVRQDQLDNMLKYAQLAEAGYQVQPQGGNRLFGGGGMQLVQDPSFVSTKALERKKLEMELDPNYEANRAAAKEKALIGARREAMFGEGQSGMGATNGNRLFGSGSNVDSTSPFIYDPITGTNKNNPSYLNELDKERLSAFQAKKSAEQQAMENKNEMLKSDAQAQLNAIQEAKKGRKYFGPLGNVPSIAAPSSLFGEYGPRKEWENNVNKLLSGRIIDLMNQMKSASKTGATGFGQLNRSELQLIQSASNVLSKDLPPDVAMKYLDQLEPLYQKMLGGSKKFGQGAEQGGNGGGVPEGVTEEDIQFTMQQNKMTREEVLRQLNG